MEQRTIFVTGAASGIGRATARLFHDRGWFVGAFDVDDVGLGALQDELGTGRCLVERLDVTDEHGFAHAMGVFSDRTDGRLDLMFNNAGIAVGGDLGEVPLDRIRRVVDVNLMGVLIGIHLAVPLLRDTDDSLCFTTASSAATFGPAGMATYGATKCAVKGLTEALSVELARYGSRAADVSPGIIDTAIWSSQRYADGEAVATFSGVPQANVGRTDAGRTLPAEDVAACVWDAYHGDGLHYYVPPEIVKRERAKVASPETVRDELIAQRRR